MTLESRIANHPMNTPSDLAYLRGKDYTNAEILAFWDRDLALGCEPVIHRPIPDVIGRLMAERERLPRPSDASTK